MPLTTFNPLTYYGNQDDLQGDCTHRLETYLPQDWDGKTISYFIWHKETDAVKIGFSSNLELRIEYLQQKLQQGIYYLNNQKPRVALHLEVLATIPAIRTSRMTCDIESILHSLLEDKQIRGEWYHLDSELHHIIRYWRDKNQAQQASQARNKGRIGFRI